MADKTRRPDAGFSLLEMVIALALFATAALAMTNLMGQNYVTAARLEERAFARTLAENLTVEAHLAPLDGTEPSAGATRLAGRDFVWSRTLTATADPDIFQLVIDVRAEPDGQILASLTSFRRL